MFHTMTANDIKALDAALFLENEESIFIHFKPTDACLIPARIRAQEEACFQVGYDMPVPIPDLRVDEEGVFGTLSFKGTPFTCFVPWECVFAIVNHDASAGYQYTVAIGTPQEDIKPKRHDAIPPPPPKQRPSYLKLVHSTPGLGGPYKPTGRLRSVQG